MRPGDLIDNRFEVEAEAGAGGMGVVFRAIDRTTGETVALKVLLGSSPHQQQRFAREAAVLAQLRHDAVAAYHAHGTLADGSLYLAMEWIEGPTLHDRLRRGPLELDEALDLGSRIAQGLGAAHAAGVVHRDVKPANILLPANEVAQAKLVDFGVAHLIEHADNTLTAAGTVVGTFRYMAPEQARGARKLDGRADLYALGAVLFECLTGRPAIREAEPANVLAKVLLQPPPHARALRPSVPPAVDDLLVRLMAKSPADRPATGETVCEQLRLVRTHPVRSPADSAISTRERRLMWVMLVSGPRSSDAPTRATTIRVPPAEPATGPVPPSSPETPPQRSADSVAAIAESYGGTVERLVDGTALVAFSSDGQSDELDRAIAAALSWQQLAPHSRIALAAGPGVQWTGSGTPEPQLQIGEVVDQATQALGTAAPGTIRLTASAGALLERRFLVVDDELRGHRPADQTDHPVLGRQHPTVGRKRELTALRALFEETVDESVVHVVLLEGEAGIGKTRLLRELATTARTVDEVAIVRGRVGWLQQRAPFGALADVLRATLGVADDESPERGRLKLESRLARNVPPEQRPRIAAFLGELLSIPATSDRLVGAARHDATLMHDSICAAVEDFFAAEAAAGPVLLLLDDVQAVDAPSLALVRAVARHLQGSPLMVVLCGRPEMRKRLDQVWPAIDAEVVALGPLSPKASEQLLHSILGPSCENATSLALRSGGNPLFIEELARASAQQSDCVGDTILAVVQARLDKLDGEARLLLRAASVFGSCFWLGGVRALTGGSDGDFAVDHWIADLERRELIIRSRSSSLGDEPEFAFVHDLVREVAYSMLTRDDLQRGHARAGAWLERAGAHDAEVLATHFQRGGMVDEALPWLMRAAQQALDANALDRAIARADEALAAGGSAIAMSIVKAQALQASGRSADALASAQVAFAKATRGGPLWFRGAIEVATAAAGVAAHDEVERVCSALRLALPRAGAVADKVSALSMVAWLLQQSGQVGAAYELVCEAEALADSHEVDDPLARAHLGGVRAVRAYSVGNVATYLRESERAADRYAAAGHRRFACGQALNVAVGYIGVGCYERAREVITGLLGLVRRLGLRPKECFALCLLSNAQLELGELGAAAEAAEQARAIATETHNVRHLGQAEMLLGRIASARGEYGDATRRLEAALRHFEASPGYRVHTLNVLALNQSRQGDAAGAYELAQQARELAERLGHGGVGLSKIALVQAEALIGLGRRAEAARIAREAAAALIARADAFGDLWLRDRFLQDIAFHARLLELDRELSG